MIAIVVAAGSLALAVAQSPQLAQRPQEAQTAKMPQPREPGQSKDIKEFEEALLKGDIPKSRTVLDRAVESKPEVERAQIQVAAADALSRLQDTASIAEAERLYANSLQSGALAGDENLRLRTQNNYAALLLKTGKAGSALTELRAMRGLMDKQPSAARARYLYNYGQAAEATSDWKLALDLYQQALATDPAFGETARAASRLALKAPSESIGIPTTVALTDRLLDEGQLEVAGNHLRVASGTQHWAGHPEYRRLLASVARYLTVAHVTREDFTKNWLGPLATAATASDPAARDRYRDLRRAYALEPFELVIEPDMARSRFAHWLTSDTDASAVVALLQEVGRQSRITGQTADALARFSSGWAISRVAGPIAADAGMAIAVDLADLLLTSGPDFAAPLLLDTLIGQLFEGKGDAYKGQDYASALRFHLLLGSIFERQQRWGPPDDPRTALFQWNMALKNHSALRSTGRPGELAEIPGVHLRLAGAWEAVGNPAASLRELLFAAEGFLNLRRYNEASQVIGRARGLIPIGTPADAQRLAALEEKLPRKK